MLKTYFLGAVSAKAGAEINPPATTITAINSHLDASITFGLSN